MLLKLVVLYILIIIDSWLVCVMLATVLILDFHVVDIGCIVNIIENKLVGLCYLFDCGRYNLCFCFAVTCEHFPYRVSLLQYVKLSCKQWLTGT